MKVSWTKRALADLARIDRWLTVEADAEVAMDQLERIRQRARRLRDFPTLPPQVRRGERSVSVYKTPYILLYRLKGDLIEILRVHHNKQNWRPPA